MEAPTRDSSTTATSRTSILIACFTETVCSAVLSVLSTITTDMTTPPSASCARSRLEAWLVTGLIRVHEGRLGCQQDYEARQPVCEASKAYGHEGVTEGRPRWPQGSVAGSGCGPSGGRA